MTKETVQGMKDSFVVTCVFGFLSVLFIIICSLFLNDCGPHRKQTATVPTAPYVSVPNKLDHLKFGDVHWDRQFNPPQNIFALSTPEVMGHPLCIESITVTAHLMDGGRNSEGDERPFAVTYSLTPLERQTGLGHHFVNMGRGHLLAVQVQSTRSVDEACPAQSQAGK